MKIRLTQIDGKLPNLALMKLSHWHKSKGDDVILRRNVRPIIQEKSYDIVYGSLIFSRSKFLSDVLVGYFPDAIIGGTGKGDFSVTVENIIGYEYEHYDYSIYPDFLYSLGFTARGCRLNCSFCVVPRKEGRPRSINTIQDIWRGNSNKNIILLDNDFFGQPKEQWKARIDEIISGDFKVCFNQGINIRLIDDNAAYWLSKVKYYDDQFKTRRIYTAWDRLQDERIFLDGVERLKSHGIPPKHLLVYMLVGYKENESWDEIFYRFNVMKSAGVLPYPMVYNNKDKDLKRFQRWVVRRYHEFIPWDEFGKSKENDKDDIHEQNLAV